MTLAIDKSARTPLFQEDEDGNTEISNIAQDFKAISESAIEQVVQAQDENGNSLVSEDTAEKTQLGVSLAIKAVGCGIASG